MPETPNFWERLTRAQGEKNSLLCVGLDPERAKLPEAFARRKDGPLEFNKLVIEATADLACCYKLNLAFYEAEGLSGLGQMELTLRRLREAGALVIGDAKRGDIGSTARAYARALFDAWGFDAVTVNPLLGRDSLEPFLEREGRGVYVLAQTSNPGAADFQVANSLPEQIARKVLEWDAKGVCGLVVGATAAAAVKRLREIAPSLPFLLPGVGAQGAKIEDFLPAALSPAGAPIVVNVSRAVCLPAGEWSPERVREAAEGYRGKLSVASTRPSELRITN
ncbi:MAG: orotidine-5'-phosphate decarboxylase [bacterium]